MKTGHAFLAAYKKMSSIYSVGKSYNPTLWVPSPETLILKTWLLLHLSTLIPSFKQKESCFLEVHQRQPG